MSRNMAYIDVCAISLDGQSAPTGLMQTHKTAKETFQRFYELKQRHAIKTDDYPFDFAFYNGNGNFIEAFGVTAESFEEITSTDSADYSFDKCDRMFREWLKTESEAPNE